VNSESKLSSVGIIGDSPVMHVLARQIETAAGCDLTAVVTGESGTGKELVAPAPACHSFPFTAVPLPKL
jgi:transcriptional regulator with GAF, ATPase, and Fis domain